MLIRHPKERWETKGENNPTADQGKGKSVKLPFLETSGSGPINEEVSGDQVKVATRHVNLYDILGKDAWGNKNWAEECSSIIDAWVDGGGFCSFPRLRKYLKYLKSFRPMATLGKTNENC